MQKQAHHESSDNTSQSLSSKIARIQIDWLLMISNNVFRRIKAMDSSPASSSTSNLDSGEACHDTIGRR